MSAGALALTVEWRCRHAFQQESANSWHGTVQVATSCQACALRARPAPPRRSVSLCRAHTAHLREEELRTHRPGRWRATSLVKRLELAGGSCRGGQGDGVSLDSMDSGDLGFNGAVSGGGCVDSPGPQRFSSLRPGTCAARAHALHFSMCHTEQNKQTAHVLLCQVV